MVQREREDKTLLPATIEETATGPTAHIDAVFREYSGMVFRAAYRVTGNPSDAEDVLQTVFMRMLRREESSVEVGSMESYLRRAAVNAAVDIVRGRQESRKVPLGDVEPVLRDKAADAGRQQSSGEIRDELRKALGALNARAAEMFSLKYFEGFDHAEIARRLQTSQAVVAVTLHRTRTRLKKDLAALFGGKS